MEAHEQENADRFELRTTRLCCASEGVRMCKGPAVNGSLIWARSFAEWTDCTDTRATGNLILCLIELLK